MCGLDRGAVFSFQGSLECPAQILLSCSAGNRGEETRTWNLPNSRALGRKVHKIKTKKKRKTKGRDNLATRLTVKENRI